jgi:hypothetical protein
VVEGAKPVVIERIKVHSPALEGNLEGNPGRSRLIVVCPPSYRANPGAALSSGLRAARLFHRAEQWIKRSASRRWSRALFANGVPEMIVVLPDSKTRPYGSVYSTRSPRRFREFRRRTTSSAYVDGHYRTIPTRESRGSSAIRWAATARRASA